jgi:hypothetical protein
MNYKLFDPKVLYQKYRFTFSYCILKAHFLYGKPLLLIRVEKKTIDLIIFRRKALKT